MEFVKFIWQISWRHILIASFAGVLSGGSNALLISVVNREVHEGHFSNALLFFALLATFILITSILAQFLLIHLSQKAVYELRLKLSRNILSSPLEHLEKLQDNRLVVILTEDINALTRAVSAIPNIFIDLTTVIACFIILTWVSSTLSTISILFTAISIWMVQRILGKSRRIFMEAREEEDTLFKSFQAIINGTKELKLNRLRREEFLEKKLNSSATKLRQKNNSAMGGFVTANGFGQILQFISLGLILFALPSIIQLPLPILATYVLITTFIALPMQNMLNRIPELVRGNVALQKIERMRLSLINLSEIEAAPKATYQNCNLQLRQVAYRYYPDVPQPQNNEQPGQPPPHPADSPHHLQNNNSEDHPPHPADSPHHLQNNNSEGRPPHPVGSPHHPQNNNSEGRPPHPADSPYHPQNNNSNSRPHPNHPPGNQPAAPWNNDEEKGFLLGPITLSIKAGDLVFIVGSNGSGKSTLAKLIAGLYTPQSGTISLNNEEITADNVEWYRQHFSATFSDVYLFEDCLGLNNPNLDQEVENYLKDLQLSHKVTVKNGVLSTINLSQGQKKRLALLTAFLEDRPIYLFDEWASDQDPAFREIFYERILLQLKQRNKIVVVITHDDRYFHLANHVIKLDYGQVEYDSAVAAGDLI
jgi:putative pyoverdin transport system ATP-binding/permease protein